MSRSVPLGVVCFVLCASLAPSLAHAEEHVRARSRPRIAGIVGGGASYGGLYGLDLGAATLEGGLTMTQSPLFAVTLSADGRIGKTLTGTLAFGDVAAAVTFDGTRGRFRLGVGPQLSYVWIGRARDSDSDRVDTFAIGLRGRVSVDLVHFDDDDSTSHRGLYLQISPQLEKFLGPNGFAWHAGAGVGIRF